MSIRLRLTLWYSGVLAATMLAAALVLYFLLAQGLTREAERAIRIQAEQVHRFLEVRRLPTGAEVVLLPRVDVFASPDTFVQAVDALGTVIGRSENLGPHALPVTQGTQATIRTGRATLERVRVGNQLLLLYNHPMFPEGGTGVIQVARTLNPVEAVLARVRFLLLVLVVAGLGLAAGLGILLARHALAPIERVTQVARQIAASGDLARRVEHRGPADEVGRLAATFNEMLGRLEEAQKRLERTLEAQRRFVADASHELRTPLTAIRTNAEVLRAGGEALSPEDRSQALADIVSEAERLGRLVTDLLTLARADAGFHLETGRADLDCIVGEVLRQARLLARGVEVEAEGRAGAVRGNADALKQLLLILTDNALKYTPAGGRVRLSARREDSWARLEVADTGRGIDPEDLPHIFERFYRADRARTAGGTGLGLAIARWIVDEHGGRIEVESAPGHGTVFRIFLPTG